MALVELVVEVGTVPTSDYARTLLDGASLYGAAGLDRGSYQRPMLAFPPDALTPAIADYPAQDDVRSGVGYGNGGYTGDVVLPDEADVRSGVGYGSGGTEYEGALAGGGNFCF